MQLIKVPLWVEDQFYLELCPSAHLPNDCNRLTENSSTKTAVDPNFLDIVLTQLTPPQSPPHILSNVNYEINQFKNERNSICPIVRVCTSINASANFEYLSWNSSNAALVNSKFVEEIERETQIVDDIVNKRAEELINWNDDSASTSSLSHTFHLSTDEECLSYGLPLESSSISSSTIHEFDKNECKETIDLITIPKKKKRPYGRGVEDRKIRKKEQNKNAATRYRQKKKQELENILIEEQELSKRNESLRGTLANRIQEAKYLKTLIQEFYKKNKSFN